MTLGGCRVYERIFHPYRLPTPPPSPEYEAKLKADKERKKGIAQGIKRNKGSKAPAEEGTTDVSTPTADASAPAEAPTRTLADGPKAKYDKHKMLKKNKLLLPKKRYVVAKPSLWQRIKYAFKKKKGKKKKSTPKPPPDVSSPTDPNSIP